MRFRNSVHILIDNFVNVYKLLLYRLVTSCIFFSLLYVVLDLGLYSVIHSTELGEIFRLIGEFFRAIATGNSDQYLQGFQDLFAEAVKNFGRLLLANIGSIVGSVIGAALLYLISRFENGLAVFAVGSALNDRMNLCARTPFASAYFKNVGRAALYQVIYVPLAFLYDLISLLICWFFFFYALSFLPLVLTISLAVTGVIALQALKFTLASGWMPAIIAGEKRVLAAFKESLTNGRSFGRRYSCFLAEIYIIVIVNVLGALCTLGSALLLTVPMTFLSLLAMQFVHYYEDNGKKYFISFRKIAHSGEEAEAAGK